MEEFLDYWCSKWPGSTRDLKVLERSAHFQGCRDAWFAARKKELESPGTDNQQAQLAIALMARISAQNENSSIHQCGVVDQAVIEWRSATASVR